VTATSGITEIFLQIILCHRIALSEKRQKTYKKAISHISDRDQLSFSPFYLSYDVNGGYFLPVFTGGEFLFRDLGRIKV
jgi:hypothetical protein